ncbi:MAG: PDZ domain-containing protein [Bryobacter sp.]|nr:PDZ domain-containing protein [Bryobacter sp.]
MSDATLRLMTTPHPGISLVQSNGRMKVDSSFATTKNGQPSKGCELKSVNGLPISQAFAVEPAGWWPRTSTFQLDLICSGANVVRSFTSVDLLQQMDFSGGAYGAYDFGLRVRPIRGGMLVVAVASNSPAEIAGVRVGMRVNGAKFLRSSSLSISLIDRLNQPYDRSGIELSIENKEDSRRVIIFPITLPVLLRNVLRPNGTIKGNKDGVRFTD